MEAGKDRTLEGILEAPGRVDGTVKVTQGFLNSDVVFVRLKFLFDESGRLTTWRITEARKEP